MEDRLSPFITTWIASDASINPTSDLPSGDQLRQAESDPASIFQIFLIVQPNPEKTEYKYLTEAYAIAIDVARTTVLSATEDCARATAMDPIGNPAHRAARLLEITQTTTILTAAETKLRLLEDKQAPTYNRLVPLANQDHSAENIAAIKAKNCYEIYFNICNRQFMPPEMLAPVDNVINNLIINAELSPAMIAYKAVELLKVRHQAFPQTAEPTQGEESRIFNAWMTNSTNFSGRIFKSMNHSRATSGMPGLLALPMYEVITALQHAILVSPQNPPKQTKKQHAAIGSQHQHRWTRSAPAAAPAPPAAPAQQQAPPAAAVPTVIRGLPVVLHPDCFITSFCRKCNVYGHHLLYCTAPLRADMPNGGFLKVCLDDEMLNTCYANSARTHVPIFNQRKPCKPQKSALHSRAMHNMFGTSARHTALIDTGATTTIFNDAAYLIDVEPCHEGLTVCGAKKGSAMSVSHAGTLRLGPDIRVKVLVAPSCASI